MDFDWIANLNYLVLFLSVCTLFIGYRKGVALCKNNPSSSKIGAIPSLLTSGGVLCTFLGIALGLLNFDTEDLNNSISILLSGLTLAFWSSIVGMMFSMMFKTRWLPEHHKALSQLTPDDMQKVLLSQLSESERANSAAKGRHQDNQKLLTDLLDEIRMIKSVSVDGNLQSKNSLSHLTDEINQFASKVSSQTSQQVALSLQSSIESFNQGLMGQFGSNFKRLDDSVVKMLEWQQQYTIQIEQLTNAFELTVESLAATEQSVESISDHTQSIPNTMKQFTQTADMWNQQISELDLRLSAFSSMREKAIEAMPEIQQRLDELGMRMEKSVLNTCESLEKGVLKASTELQEKALAMSEKLVDASSGIGSDLSNASGQIESMTNHLASSAENIQTIMQDSIGQLEGTLNSLLKGTKEDVLDISKTLSNVNESLIDKHREQLDKTGKLLTSAHDAIDKKIDDSLSKQMKGSLQVQKTIESDLIKSSTVFQQNIQFELEQVLNHLGRGLLDITEEFSKSALRLNKELQNLQPKEVPEEVS